MHKSSVAKRKVATEIPFMLIPVEDRQLVRKFGLGLQDYWLDCWETDPYGSRYILMPDADLKSTTQAKYRKQLEKLGLFMFEIRTQGGDRKLWVLNRHGSRVKDFWKGTREIADESKQSLVGIEVQPDGIEPQLDQIEPQLDQIERLQPQTQSNQGFQNPSISFQYLIDQYTDQDRLTAEPGLNVDEKKDEPEEFSSLTTELEPLTGTVEELQPESTGILKEPQPDPIAQIQQATVQLLDEREVFNQLRRLGIETNEVVRATMKKHQANVPGAIAHIQQRYDKRENFKNITGAFIKACKEGAKPQSARTEVNPPTDEQLAVLETAKATRLVRDYYLAPYGDHRAVLVDDDKAVMPWWEYFSAE